MTKAFATLAWGLTTVIVLFLITQPISLQAHLIVGIIVVLVLTAIKWFPSVGLRRQVFLALGTTIILRYVYWRSTSTIPPINQPENFIPGVILYVFEMYSVLMLALSLFTVADPTARKPAPPPAPETAPSVDIFIPTYNEDEMLLATTVAAAVALDYPKDRLKVYLLDDGGTDQKCNSSNPAAALEAQQRRVSLQKMCADLGATYLTRARNEHAKAGNLNAALAKTDGDLVAVFDADHCPTRDFLQNTVGFFVADPKLFLVQTPHFFINPDPLEHNLNTFERMPSENEQFYGMVQRGLDRWDASFFCGSAALLRRQALKITNGFSGVSITEDCETALELHAQGWHSVYLEKPMIAGLQPETFANFIGQRSRWAQGMLQILILKNPVGRPGLTLAQRLCYMTNPLFWLFPIGRLVFLISPLLYLFFGLQIFSSSGGEFFAYTFTYMIVNMMIQNYLYGKYRWPWISELYEYIQSIYLFRAIVAVVLNPRKPTFKVTSKGDTLDENQVSELAAPYFIMFAILLVGVGATIWRMYTQPYLADITMVVGGWNVFNLLMAAAAIGVVAERRNLRRAPRVEMSRTGELEFDGQVVPAMIEDGSMGGVRLRPLQPMDREPERMSKVVLRFETKSGIPNDGLPMVVRNVARDGEGVHFGCQPTREEPVHVKLIADLVFGDSTQWSNFQQRRRRSIGVLHGTLFYLHLAAFHSLRGLSYLLRRRRKPVKARA